MKTKIKVTGMSCEHCVKRVTKAIESIAGIKDVQVDLKSGEATFDKPETVSMEEIVKAIKEVGYGVEV
ncbi:Copper chaperone CopZ [Candidatus Methanoperedenaceae archaeon GB50]|nr:cation transporter [Candidatus Desulfofervidus auxilii]CAD7779012.1 MAG: Copper chaperone CopZ [Candidatus Methanoperedenaceae archaeon GB37]CAD7779057.1 Copper chaperone CopZ [Candidatus Methanoperedenaceae archaeon GB50]CAD7780243.1 Copper chaperone CopZ [Candidatus Methanoperedenaceae archaeon GB37]